MMDIPEKIYLNIWESGQLEYTPHSYKRISDSDIVYRREPAWVSVDDGLPEDGAWVWIARAGKRWCAREAIYVEGKWIADTMVDPWEYEDVTHFMLRQERPEIPEVSDEQD